MTKRTCTTCGHGPARFDGCSHTECPNRRLLSAQPIGVHFSVPLRGVEGRHISCDAGFRREPSIKEVE